MATTSEKLLKKLRSAYPEHPALVDDDLYLISNKSHLRFGVCFNWSSSRYPQIFSYYTMTECLRLGELFIEEHYENCHFQGYLVYPKDYNPYKI